MTGDIDERTMTGKRKRDDAEADYHKRIRTMETLSDGRIPSATISQSPLYINGQGELVPISKNLHVGDAVADFTADVLLPLHLREAPEEPFGSFSLKESRDSGKWVVLLFYPRDFTFVCPTELIAFSERVEFFEREFNAQLLACSTDSKYAHLAWSKLPANKGGLGGDSFRLPLLSDLNMALSRIFGTLLPSFDDTRSVVVLEPKQSSSVIVYASHNDLPVGRSVSELERILSELQSAQGNKMSD